MLSSLEQFFLDNYREFNNSTVQLPHKLGLYNQKYRDVFPEDFVQSSTQLEASINHYDASKIMRKYLPYIKREESKMNVSDISDKMDNSTSQFFDTQVDFVDK